MSAGESLPPLGGPAGSGAKEQADYAKQLAQRTNELLKKAKWLVDIEIGLLDEKAQAIEELGTMAEGVEENLPELPEVGSPSDELQAKGKYDAAIQITGATRQMQEEAHAQADEIRLIATVTAEALQSATTLLRQAEKERANLDSLSSAISESVEQAEVTASNAAEAADKSSREAKKAAKEDASDKRALKKAARQDKKYVSAARKAAQEASSAAVKFETDSLSTVWEYLDNIAGIKDLTEERHDNMTRAVTALDVKLKPYADNIQKAEGQEAKYKAELSEQDAEAVLEQRYAELGGDPELSKALADMDEAFQKKLNNARLQLDDWWKNRTQEVEQRQEKIEQSLEVIEEWVTTANTWHDREESNMDESIYNLEDDKLATEPGKELQERYDLMIIQVELVSDYISAAEEMTDRQTAISNTIEDQQAILSAKHESLKKYIDEQETEVDNGLQMASMSLDEKVDYLQRRPKDVRERNLQKIEIERAWIVKETETDTTAEDFDFSPPTEIDPGTQIDWTPIIDEVNRLQSSPLEELQQGDPKLATVLAEYDQGGGDRALMEMWTAQWKEQVEEHETRRQDYVNSYEQRIEQARQQADQAGHEVQKYDKLIKQKKEELLKALVQDSRLDVKEAVGFWTRTDLTPEEHAKRELLERQFKPLRNDLDNLRAVQRQSVEAKDTSEQLHKQIRQQYQAVMNSDHDLPPNRPSSDVIHEMSLRAKYEELTGKSAPK